MTPTDEQVPMRIPLPVPPVVELDGVQYLLEYVPIDQLHTWAHKHNVAPYRKAFLGKPGWRPTANNTMRFSGLGDVMLYGPRSWSREAQ